MKNERIFQLNEDALIELLDSHLRTFAMKILYKHKIDDNDIQEFIGVVKPHILGEIE